MYRGAVMIEPYTSLGVCSKKNHNHHHHLVECWQGAQKTYDYNGQKSPKWLVDFLKNHGSTVNDLGWLWCFWTSRYFFTSPVSLWLFRPKRRPRNVILKWVWMHVLWQLKRLLKNVNSECTLHYMMTKLNEATILCLALLNVQPFNQRTKFK